MEEEPREQETPEAAAPQPASAGGPTPESPFGRRFRAYLDERFPLDVNGPAILVLFGSSFLVGNHLLHAYASLLGWRPLLGILVVTLFFFRLRVFDELKDIAYDRQVHPDRLVVRGVIGMGELRVMAVLAVLGEAGLAWLIGRGAFIAWCAAAFWSLLMLFEFFCESWLRPRPGAYMFTHMIVMPLLTFFCYAVSGPFDPISVPMGLYLFALASVLVTASLETARKIRLPAEEAPEVESYSSAWGFGVSLGVAGGMQVASYLIMLLMGRSLGLGQGYWLSALAGLVLTSATLARFGMGQDARLSGKLEKIGALYFMIFHIGLIVTLWS